MKNKLKLSKAQADYYIDGLMEAVSFEPHVTLIGNIKQKGKKNYDIDGKV